MVVAEEVAYRSLSSRLRLNKIQTAEIEYSYLDVLRINSHLIISKKKGNIQRFFMYNKVLIILI